MKNHKPRVIPRGMLMVLILFAVFASGCAAIPPAFSKVSWVLSSVSYVTTSKGPSDHAISYVARQDCSLFRLIKFQAICQPISDDSNQSLISWVINKFRKPVEEPVFSFGPQVVSTATFYSPVPD
jgi:hypothetical protein